MNLITTNHLDKVLKAIQQKIQNIFSQLSGQITNMDERVTNCEEKENLPEVTTDDDGKKLVVVDGEWVAVSSSTIIGESAIDESMVTSESTGTASCEKKLIVRYDPSTSQLDTTWKEMHDFRESGGIVIALADLDTNTLYSGIVSAITANESEYYVTVPVAGTTITCTTNSPDGYPVG